jgi:hypothetical protein
MLSKKKIERKSEKKGKVFTDSFYLEGAPMMIGGRLSFSSPLLGQFIASDLLRN